MKTINFLYALTCFLKFSSTQAKIGFFWHITDFHYDPMYMVHSDVKQDCRRNDERSYFHRSAGPIGDYACDTSLSLIESACVHMRTRHSDNIEFVLWSGDIVSSNVKNEDERLQAVKNMTELLGRTFSSQFVFPVLGHLDPSPSLTFEMLWNQWLPTDALTTSKHGGYYTIEQSHSKLRLVALNTNLMTIKEQHSPHSKQQWEWLDSVFTKAVTMKEMVYIVGHTAPGSDERNGESRHLFSSESNRKYIRLIRKYNKIIAGQFFGHLHSDTFRIFYDQSDKPISWAFVAPALATHRTTAGFNNPGLRLYKYDTNSGQVLDYMQYYLDLTQANKGEAIWAVEYNFTQHYGLHDVTAHSLHRLVGKFRVNNSQNQENHLFKRYIRANNVRLGDGVADQCNTRCVNEHICTITKIDYEQKKLCSEDSTAAKAPSRTFSHLIFSIMFALYYLI